MILGFKGFKPGLIATLGDGSYQYQPGEVSKTEKAKCANTGFHYCLDPLDCLNWYAWDGKNEFWAIAAGGDIDEDDYRTRSIVILIMAVLSVVAIRFGYKALLIEWAIDAISKAEKEFVGTKLGEARLAVVVSWLREKVPAPIRFLVTDDLIRKAVQTSFNAAKSGLEVLKNA